MSGPGHYRDAEACVKRAEGLDDPVSVANHLLAAQVHATLALAAATVHAASPPDRSVFDAWKETVR